MFTLICTNTASLPYICVSLGGREQVGKRGTVLTLAFLWLLLQTSGIRIIPHSVCYTVSLQLYPKDVTKGKEMGFYSTRGFWKRIDRGKYSCGINSAMLENTMLKTFGIYKYIHVPD